MTPTDFFDLLKSAYSEFNQRKGPRLGAALAYYAVFSLAPLLIVLTAIAGMVFHSDVRGRIDAFARSEIGPQGAAFVHDTLQHASNPRSTMLAAAIGILTALAGAAGVFSQLQDALNTIWGVEPPRAAGWVGALRQRAAPFLMVLGCGLLLLLSLVVSASISAFGSYLARAVPLLGVAAAPMDSVVSMLVFTAIFALIFRELPAATIVWRDVWSGAIVTAALYTLAKFGLGLYLGHVAAHSTYGPAGSLVLLLLWIYYAAQILLFGAAFTHVAAGRRVGGEHNCEPQA